MYVQCTYMDNHVLDVLRVYMCDVHVCSFCLFASTWFSMCKVLCFALIDSAQPAELPR